MAATGTGGKTYSLWLKFFRKAGIPAGYDTKYAVMFDENRMRMDMLMDLNKECLRDMGIVAMGDIIAILKHAKAVHEQSKEQSFETVMKPAVPLNHAIPTKEVQPFKKVAEPSASSNNSPITVTKKLTDDNIRKPAPTPSSNALNKSAASSTQLPKSSSESTSSNKKPIYDGKDLSIRRTIVLGSSKSKTEEKSREEVPLQKKTRVLPEHEGKYKIIMPEGTTVKTKRLLEKREIEERRSNSSRDEGVFSRLGNHKDGERGRPSEPSSANGRDRDKDEKNSVFARLGSKSGLSSISQKISTSTSSINVDRSSKYDRYSDRAANERTLVTIPSQLSMKRHHPRSPSPDFERRAKTSRPSVSISTSRLRSEASIVDRSRQTPSVKCRLGSASDRSLSKSISPPRHKHMESSRLNSDRSSNSSISVKDRLAPRIKNPVVDTREETDSPRPKVSLLKSKLSTGTILKEERVRSATTGKFVIKRTILKKKSSL